MPLINFSTSLDSVEIYLWEITEELSVLEESFPFTDGERELYYSYKSEMRKLHWLSSRYIVKKIYGNDAFIFYSKEGRPIISNSTDNISISHSGIYACVIVSSEYDVGIDIEKIANRINNVRKRFVNEDENNVIASNDIDTLTLYWAIKEATYKLFSDLDLEFADNINVKVGALDDINVQIVKGNFHSSLKAYYDKLGDYYIAFLYIQKNSADKG
ncbi:MAG: hypothetical protein A2X12_06575 [Bacteroidetes bacterium GWE2_29_8]|nr:MAG: hypothetical protein A2X12_06575 [Bacteroidetes bacterium GWE2_29_8]